ncbi:MAG: hypothetical protein HY296_05005 [Thaumarchaeota archaeon]|nr:hypothetical protein [Nitrososphaerota archaeon]
MVKVSYTPNTDVAVHEVIEEDSSSFFEEIVRQMLASPVHIQPTVNWIDGIAFVVSPMPATEDVIRENLAGRIHFAAVMFARAPYQAQANVKVNNQEFSVRLRKAENNPTLVELVRFLQAFKRS